MCEPTTIMLASAAASAVGQVQQGRAAAEAGDANARSLNYQASVERDNAQAEASAIRRAGARARGETLAGIAASGVQVGQGSALDAEREVMSDTETDAMMAILNGDRAARGLNQQARAARQAGRQAKSAAMLGAATSLLSAGGQAYKSGMFNKSSPAPYDYRGTTLPDSLRGGR